MKKLTKEQAVVLTGFTGVMCVHNFGDFHADIEKRLGRPVWTHEFASKEMNESMREVYRDDFMALVWSGDAKE